MDASSYIKQFTAASTYEARNEVFDKAKDAENEHRKSFMTMREEGKQKEFEHLCDPSKSLVPVFDCGISGGDDDAAVAFDYFKALPPPDPSIPRLFPLRESDSENALHHTHAPRRHSVGDLSVLKNVAEFKHHFLDLFGEGLLRNLNWDNIIAAGGAVAGCVSKIPTEFAANNLTKRRFFHDIVYSGSDIDLFIYGLDEERGKAEIDRYLPISL